MDNSDLEEILVDLERGLVLPTGFLRDLLTQDDWSFVIKCHALVESAVTYVLTAALDSRLADTMGRLNIGGRSGKIAFLDALELFDSDQRDFIRRLSELRNSVVHDVKNVNFTFATHVASLTTQQRSQFAKFAVYFVRYQQDPQKKQKFVDEALTYPKFNLWWGMIGVLLHAYEHIIEARALNAERAVNSAIAKELSSFGSSPGAS